MSSFDTMKYSGCGDQDVERMKEKEDSLPADKADNLF